MQGKSGNNATGGTYTFTPRLPKRLYRLVVQRGEGERLWVYEEGSKTYASFPDLKHRYDYHRGKGRNVQVFKADVEWTEITLD